MLITAAIFIAIGAALIVQNGVNSAQAVASLPLRRTVIAGSILAALVASALIWEGMVPTEPAGRSVVQNTGDEVPLGDVQGGLLTLEIVPLEGVKKTGGPVNVSLYLKGAADKQKTKTLFQFGAKQSSTEAKDEVMAANVRLEPLGKDTTLTLTATSPKDKVTVHVSYHPNRFPVRWALILLGFLAVMAAMYEAAAPSGWRRTFLTSAIACVGTFAWLLEDGLTPEDGFWAVWIRLAYGVAAGAMAGTLIPSLLSMVLPEFQGVENKKTASKGPTEASSLADQPALEVEEKGQDSE